MRTPGPKRPPALADWALALCLGESEAADAARGDLREEFEARADAGGFRASLWYAREAGSLAWAFGRERALAAARGRRAGARKGRQGDSIMRILWEDLRFAAVALVRRPLFAGAVVATLALGIGGNVALFSVVDGVLLRPLPYADPERLVMLWENDRLRGSEREAVSAPDFRDFVADEPLLRSLAARERLDRTLGAATEPVRVSSARVSAGYFAMLGVRPLLGRTFLRGGGDARQRPRGRGHRGPLARALRGRSRRRRPARAARRRALHARGRGAGRGAGAGPQRSDLRAARVRPERPVPRTSQPARLRAAAAGGQRGLGTGRHERGGEAPRGDVSRRQPRSWSLGPLAPGRGGGRRARRPAAAVRRGRPAAADGLRQRRQPRPHARRRPRARARDPHLARRGPVAPLPPAAHREPAARLPRRRRRARSSRRGS